MLNLGHSQAGIQETNPIRAENSLSAASFASEILAQVVPTPHRRPWRSREEMRELIAQKHAEIMEILGLDLTDDSLAQTPERVAKMYVDEIFSGLWEEEFPKITVVENRMSYDEMLVETGITFNSTCEHHFLPILGRAHIAYVCKDKVLGLSKFNRVVDHFARRPQVQERANVQIHQALVAMLGTEDVAVVIDAVHTCVKTRGVGDHGTVTRTQKLSGVFQKDPLRRSEFLAMLPLPSAVAVG
jgi:GTP cyclohydrolase I